MARSFLFSPVRVIAFILVFAGAFCTAAGADVLSDNGFSGSPRAGCEPLTVAFSDDSSGATGWLWYFGDGASSTAQHPVHTYTRPGFYSVTRIVKNITGIRTQSSTKMVRNYIAVYATPAVNFTAVPVSGTAPLTVQFYDQSRGAYNWSWDFGDGGRSNAQDPQHTYLAPGSYTVSLTVTNICGTKTAQKDDYVTVEGPKIGISHQDLAIGQGESFDFGPTGIGSVSTAEFQIENKGSGLLELTGAPPVRVTGSDAHYFEVVRQPAVTFPASQTSDPGVQFPFQIPSGFNFSGFPSFGPSLPEAEPEAENSSFVIAFAPDEQGSYSARIEIVSNDSDQTPYVIDLYGQAVDQSGLDSDQDGLPDLWEVRFGLDPYDPGDAGSDADQDGKSNLDEYQQQSDPLSAEAPVPFSDDFEGGRLSNYWSRGSTAGGEIRVTESHGPISGVYHVTMAAAQLGVAQLNELVLSLDLLGQSGVWLSFWHKNFGGEDHLMPQHFTGSVNADGVAISHDGLNWHKLQGLTRAEGSSDEWRIFEISLDAAMAEAGIDYTNSFKIKFQQFGDGPILSFFPAASDGFAFDDVRVYLDLEAEQGLLQSNTARDLRPAVSGADMAELVAGNSQFALDFYHHLRSENDGSVNLFFSPYSISLALAMTYAGARHETAQQMADALTFSLPQDRLHPAFNALDLALSSRGRDAHGKDGEGFRLKIANSLWGQKDYSFSDAFLNTLGGNYGAGLRLVDFADFPDQSRLTINDWVGAETEGRIEDLIPPGAVTPLTRLVLANAIYFNAAWAYPFEKTHTHAAPFYPANGPSVDADMMVQEKFFGLAQGDAYQAVELPYDGNEISMVILLPRGGYFDEFERELTSKKLNTILGNLEFVNVRLKMPRFGYSADSMRLKDILSQMGMPVAFSGQADFSGMDGRGDLYIGDVIHKAFVEVDEAGTEAAAATAVMMQLVSVRPPPVEVNANRPFIFLIRDTETNCILFIGRIVNPEA